MVAQESQRVFLARLRRRGSGPSDREFSLVQDASAGSSFRASTCRTPISMLRALRSAPTARGRPRRGSTGPIRPNRPSSASRCRIRRAARPVRRRRRSRSALQASRDRLAPGTISACLRRWLARLRLRLGSRCPRRRLLVGQLSMARVEVSRTLRARPAPLRPRLLRGAGHRPP